MTNNWNTADIFPSERSDAQEIITDINKSWQQKDISRIIYPKDTHDRYNDTLI